MQHVLSTCKITQRIGFLFLYHQIPNNFTPQKLWDFTLAVSIFKFQIVIRNGFVRNCAKSYFLNALIKKRIKIHGLIYKSQNGFRTQRCYYINKSHMNDYLLKAIKWKTKMDENYETIRAKIFRFRRIEKSRSLPFNNRSFFI